MASWLKICGIGIGCLWLWLGFSDRGLAQSSSQPMLQPIGPLASDAKVDQTVDRIVLPAADDVPEEILRTEVIFEARSPIDGAVLSAADYAQLQAELAEPQTSQTLNSEIRYLIFLLQARRAFKPIIPFLP